VERNSTTFPVICMVQFSAQISYRSAIFKPMEKWQSSVSEKKNHPGLNGYGKNSRVRECQLWMKGITYCTLCPEYAKFQSRCINSGYPGFGNLRFYAW
jgi:hypothetical protein